MNYILEVSIERGCSKLGLGLASPRVLEYISYTHCIAGLYVEYPLNSGHVLGKGIIWQERVDIDPHQDSRPQKLQIIAEVLNGARYKPSERDLKEINEKVGEDNFFIRLGEVSHS
jgi:hypothetical protein